MLQYATKVPLSADDSQNCKRISGIDKADPTILKGCSCFWHCKLYQNALNVKIKG